MATVTSRSVTRLAKSVVVDGPVMAVNGSGLTEALRAYVGTSRRDGDSGSSRRVAAPTRCRGRLSDAGRVGRQSPRLSSRPRLTL
jgi:hypothetical protein